MALLAIPCAAAEEAIGAYHSTTAGLGLSVSFSKTKFFATGNDVTEEEM